MMLPFEPHWYAARESMSISSPKCWPYFDRYVKDAPPPKAKTAAR